MLALAGMPLGIATRRGGKPAAFVVAIGVIALWWLIYVAGEAWMRAERVSPTAAAWLPDVVIGIIGIALLVRLRRQHRISVYRVLRHVLLLAGLALFILSLSVGLGRLAPRMGGEPPPFPVWDFVGAMALFLAYMLIGRFRDPVARRLAGVMGAFRRSGPRSEGGEHI